MFKKAQLEIYSIDVEDIITTSADPENNLGPTDEIGGGEDRVS